VTILISYFLIPIYGCHLVVWVSCDIQQTRCSVHRPRTKS